MQFLTRPENQASLDLLLDERDKVETQVGMDLLLKGRVKVGELFCHCVEENEEFVTEEFGQILVNAVIDNEIKPALFWPLKILTKLTSDSLLSLNNIPELLANLQRLVVTSKPDSFGLSGVLYYAAILLDNILASNER